MKLLGITRSSNQDVAEGYGPAIQEAELIAYTASTGDSIITTRHITEPATINLEERQLFQAVIAEAIQLKQSNQCDGLLFSRCDRLSRKMDTAIQVALDLRKAGLAIVLVRENQTLKPDDPPINFVMFILQAFGVDTQTRIFLKNTKEGQRKAADAGKLPSGVGGKGLYGYNLVGPQGEKKFQPNGNVWIVDEVLTLGLSGGSINSITRTLRGKRVAITRDTVRKILKHARVYAGIYHWGQKDIEGLVPPRITLEEAKAIEGIMQRNKELSYGWGKRKWLTGRVRCGLCSGSYALELGKKRCHCRHSNGLESLNPCPAPKIAYKKLESIIWLAFMANISRPEVLKQKLVELRQNWQVERDRLYEQVGDLEAQLKRLMDKKERLLWQHSEGFISDKELKKQYKAIEPSIQALSDRVTQLRAIANQPAPPDPERASEFALWWSGLAINTKYHAAEEQKAQIAEASDLKVTIFPAENAQLRLQIAAKIPLGVDQIEVDRNGKHGAMVRPSLRRR